MGEPHLPLQAWDSLTWAHHHPKRGKGSVVTSIHGPHVVKYLTTIFGGPYVQNYLYTVCPTEMEGGANCVHEDEMIHTLGIYKDLKG